MPIYEEAASGPATLPATVQASAAVELFWLSFWATGGAGQKELVADHPVRRYLPDLEAVLGGFWDDAERCFTEVVALANQAGHLFDRDPATLLEALSSILPAAADPPLQLETAETRAAVLARVRRLRAEPDLRRRYVAALTRAWDIIAPEWAERGLAMADGAAEAARARLAAGADLWQVIPHLGERFDPAIEDAVARAELAISPGYFGGRWMIMDLPGLVLFGFRPDGSGESRRRMGGLAGRLKALADPTRLAILAHVARTPASITELTGVFGVTQPALSAHFKILRDAAFVTGTRVGGRTIYSIDGDRVEAALDECAGAIIPVPAAIRPERAPG